MADTIFYFFAFIGVIVFTAYYTYKLVYDIKDDETPDFLKKWSV